VERLIKETLISDLYQSFLGNNNLIVGCGTEREIHAISRNWPKLKFVGIDLELSELVIGTNYETKFGDVEKLDFGDSSFDFAYCFHVLEHVRAPERALEEIWRVLDTNRWLFIGTPNKSRVLGYFSSGSSLREFINWNLNDLRMRINGNWSNEKGAHAGFTLTELENLLNVKFSEVYNVSDNYYFKLYHKYRFILKFLKFVRLFKYVYPSIYFIAKKN